MYWKKHSIYRIQCYLQFQASIEGLGTYPLWIRKDYRNLILLIWKQEGVSVAPPMSQFSNRGPSNSIPLLFQGHHIYVLSASTYG